MKIKTIRQKSGFTLVELLIAMTIFSLFSLSVAAVAVSAVGAQRKAFGIQNTEESVRFAMESVVVELKYSYLDHVIEDGAGIAIITPRGDVVYYFDEGSKQLWRNNTPITPENIDVSGRFVVGAGTPVISIAMQVISNQGKQQEQTKIYVQSTATTRAL